MERTILHCDCNAYFASVESIGRPELKQVPMAVCGDPESRHGIILAKNELAKAFGVTTTETVWQAKRKCPQLVLVPSHHALYESVSAKINDIYEQYTDQVEPFSVDESWLDVTGSLHMFGTGKEIADCLRKRLREEIGITISVGVSFNKIFAKLGSDYRKPDATTVITKENFQQILWPLPARDMIFVGSAAAEKLEKAGIETIGQIAGAGSEYLRSLLGKSGETLWNYAMGLDDSPVARRCEEGPPKSIGNGITFPRDLTGMRQVEAGLLPLCDQVGTRLRGCGRYCTTVAVQIKNPQFQTISRQQRLEAPTSATREIYETACGIVRRCWRENAPVRMLTVTVSGLTESGTAQMRLLDDATEARLKSAKLDGVMDTIRGRYGKDAIAYASMVKKPEKQ